MPLGSPIGSARGIQTAEFLRIIIEQSSVPVIVDAGIGMPSHAAQAIEAGAHGVLVNTAIAAADNPIKMAGAFKLAVRAAENAIGAGPVEKRAQASASSPLTGFLD
jgi:thiazole synthase